jgi:hypothetical protein
MLFDPVKQALHCTDTNQNQIRSEIYSKNAQSKFRRNPFRSFRQRQIPYLLMSTIRTRCKEHITRTEGISLLLQRYKVTGTGLTFRPVPCCGFP